MDASWGKSDDKPHTNSYASNKNTCLMISLIVLMKCNYFSFQGICGPSSESVILGPYVFSMSFKISFYTRESEVLKKSKGNQGVRTRRT